MATTCLTYADLYPFGVSAVSTRSTWTESQSEYLAYRMSDLGALYGWWNLELDVDTGSVWDSGPDDFTSGPRWILPSGHRFEVYRPHVFGMLPPEVYQDYLFTVCVRVHPVMHVRRIDSRTIWPTSILAVQMHTTKTLSILARAPACTVKELAVWQGTVSVSVTYGVRNHESVASAFYNIDMGFTHGLGKRL